MIWKIQEKQPKMVAKREKRAYIEIESGMVGVYRADNSFIGEVKLFNFPKDRDNAFNALCTRVQDYITELKEIGKISRTEESELEASLEQKTFEAAERWSIFLDEI